MSVTVVSCLYGDTPHAHHVPAWEASIRALNPRPHETIVYTDRGRDIPAAHVFVADCHWRHPQAFYLQRAVECALTEWVWIVDIDDLAVPDALAGIDEVAADVWMIGIEQDGERYVPPPMTAADVLAAPTSRIPGASMVRVEAFKRCGGFPDVAFQDWGLWRRLAACGATFEPSGRVQYLYRRGEHTRTHTELTPERRAAHVAEMMEREQQLRETKLFARYYVESHAAAH